MKILPKTKLLTDGKHSYIEAREYELFKDKVKLLLCENPNYPICSHEGEKFMILTISQQRKGKVVNTLQSKYPPYSYYRMYKFLWKPEAQQREMFSTSPSVFQGLKERYPDLVKKLRS